LISNTFRFAILALGATGIGFIGSSSGKVEARQSKDDYAYVDQIFRKYDCVDCHVDSSNAAAKLRLTTYEGLLEGGRSGDAVEEGKSGDSLLLQVVSGSRTPRMPPGNGSGLSKDEIAVLKKWIDDGAKASPYSKALSRYYEARRAKNYDDALKACDGIDALKINGVDTAGVAAQSRYAIYAATKDERGWYDAAKKVIEIKGINGNVTNDLAWTIVDPKTWLKTRDLDLAMRAVNMAVANTRRKSGAVLDTLAWVYFQQGDKAKAIETEKEAMKCSDAEGATLDALKESMTAFGG
jgi:tetratricopeptide (TPR) repeat protein